MPKVPGSVWIASDGIYRLILCPQGHQLVNSIDGTSNGEFSQVSQRCKPCLSGQYIIDPNINLCEDCPAGAHTSFPTIIRDILPKNNFQISLAPLKEIRPYTAVTGASCPDGTSFLPNIAGSEWKAIGGIYSLVSCPPGYELVLQECMLCPASSYCLGGSAAPIPCPEELFSSPGSNSSSCCRPVVFVIISISFRVFVQDFSSSEHEKLKQGLVLVSNIPPGDIEEVGVSASGYESTLAIYKVATNDAISAEHLRLKLGQILLKASSIAFQGLPDACLQSITVSACPPGFKLNSDFGQTNIGKDGLCEVCPPGYYCSGGSLVPTPCPTSSFALTGSNSSSACTFAVFVIIMVTIQMPESNFTSSLQRKYVTALGLASKSAAERISILSVSSAAKARRMESGQTRVESEIAAMDVSSARDISNHLDISTLNFELSAQGLPAASLNSITVLASSLQSTNTQQWVIALSVVSVVVALLLAVLVYLRIFHQKVLLTDDSDLMLKITDIRQRLSLMPKDGFFLNSEKKNFWNTGKEVSFLRLSNLEAAGRMALFCDFDIMNFDAFCLSLYLELHDGNKKRYQALCQWILELSEKLINPVTFQQDQHSQVGCTTVDGRFRFFVQKVGKVRIWIDDDELFLRLKDKAQLFMDQIAIKCDLRYRELCNEPRGQELVSLHYIMQQDAQNWSSWKGHSLLRFFSSGPFSRVSQSATAEAFPAVCGFADVVFERKQTGSDVYSPVLSSSVYRQDHAEVRFADDLES